MLRRKKKMLLTNIFLFKSRFKSGLERKESVNNELEKDG